MDWLILTRNRGLEKFRIQGCLEATWGHWDLGQGLELKGREACIEENGSPT